MDVILVALALICGQVSGAVVKVTVKQGVLAGLNTTTRSGKILYEFNGVPYAKPPVGDLRFKLPAPQDPEPWSDVKSAIEVVPKCAQMGAGPEDCLYLNVWTPELPVDDINPGLPVMVWIHGGAFALGNGNPRLCSPYFFIDKRVIVVMINYRLGTFDCFWETSEDKKAKENDEI
uniref:Carboxylesterase type B domain-containing protein n=1 Tax=Timema genevievae TaxID=629358 RepID=A0A7R9PPT5_TIMGE|nr:unnamed protein product [Timema genevievae]